MTNSPRKHETDTKPTKDNNNWFFPCLSWFSVFSVVSLSQQDPSLRSG